MTDNFILDKLVMAGVDYKKTPLEVREKVSFTLKSIEKAYEKFKIDNKTKEVVILSTCNRSEIYLILNDYKDKDYLIDFYSEFFSVSKSEIEKFITLRTSVNAVNHLFQVTCGFKSLVLGEDQILGQVKNHYEKALLNNSTGKYLNRLFLDSITTAKKIRTFTGISENSLSISSIGVKLIERKLGDIIGKNILVVGLGDMSRITLQNIFERPVGKVFVTNRTSKKITDFAQEFPEIVQVDFQDFYTVLPYVDVVITCTSAPHYVLYKEKFARFYKNRPLFILDLAVPRDVEQSIDEFENVRLYRLDDLDKIARENIQKRLAAKDQGMEILNCDVEKFIRWIEETKAVDLIIDIHNFSKQLLSAELAELRVKLEEMPEEQRICAEESLKNVTKSLLHFQTIRIKELMSKHNKQKDKDDELIDIEEDCL